MMGWDDGMGAGGWIAMTIFWVALITLIIWGVSRARPTGSAERADSAESILDRRFAAGELDEKTYLSMRATLRSSRTTGTESS